MAIITLRSVYKTKTYYFTPVKQSNGLYPDFVKRVRINPNGDSEMILSNEELESKNYNSFIPEDLEIKVEDGTTFDLDNPFQKSCWEAIKNSELIVPERGAKDDKGNLIIDGDAKRYGIAEIWIEKPGEETEKRVKKTKLIVQAQNFVLNDSFDGLLTKCKLLGKNMINAPASDVTDWLLSKASSNPNLVIDLYTGQDTQLKLLLIEAQNKGVILKKDGVFMYGETMIGMTEDSVILFFKDPKNKVIFDSIKHETYPDMFLKMNNVDKKSKTKDSQ